jgi:hypothetical protein
MEVADIDYTGLTAKQMTSYQDYASKFINTATMQANTTGEAVSNMGNAEKLVALKGTIKQTVVTNKANQEILAGVNKDGEYWYADSARLSESLMVKTRKAEEERQKKLNGEEYDATALDFVPLEEAEKIENANHGVVSEKYWEADEDTRSQVYSLQGSGKLERTQLTNYQNSSMVVLKPDSVDAQLDSEGKPIVVAETPDSVVNDIRMNDKRYDKSLDYRVDKMKEAGIKKGTDADGNPIYYNKKDLIRNDYLEAGGAKTDITNIDNMWEKPTVDKPTTAEDERNLLYLSTKRGAGHILKAQTKRPDGSFDTEGLDNYLGTLGNSNVSFTRTVTTPETAVDRMKKSTTYKQAKNDKTRKIYLDRARQEDIENPPPKPERIILAKVKKIWYEKESIISGNTEGGFDVEMAKVGIPKKAQGDYFLFPIPLSKSPTVIMGTLMNLTGKVNKTGYEEVVNQAMDDYNKPSDESTGGADPDPLKLGIIN